MSANRRSREQSEEDDLLEFDDAPIVDGEEEGASADSASVRGRGRPPVPAQWTKVISLGHDNLEKLRTYDLATDLLMAPSLPGLPTTRREKHWAPIFSSQMFVKEHKDLTLPNYQLRERRLKALGKQFSECRKSFRDAALEGSIEPSAQLSLFEQRAQLPQ